MSDPDGKATDEVRFRIAVLALNGFGLARARRVIAMTGCPPTKAKSLIEAVAATDPGKKTFTITLDQARAALVEADSVLASCAEQDIMALPILAGERPMLIELIDEAPLVLYVRGDKNLLRRSGNVAIVGAREPSEWSRRCAARISQRCVEAERVVVSGLAKGCDSAAHEEAIDRGGLTIAVLAHGLDAIYPLEHRGLAERILESGGALVSEYVPGTPVKPYRFIERDRIQSGLSDGAIVVESTEDGGTMHTARFARVQGRELGVVTGKDARFTGDRFTGNRLLLGHPSVRALAGAEDLESFLDNTRVDDEGWPCWAGLDPLTATTIVGYRQYVPTHRLVAATEEGREISNRIIQLKKGAPEWVRRFAEELSMLWGPILGNPDAIVVVPSSKADAPPSGIHGVAKELSRRVGAAYLEGSLKRVKSLPSAHLGGPRVRSVQRESMTFIPGERDHRRVLLLDDVYTTGSTMGGALDVMRKDLVRSKTCIIGLAIGKTRGRPLAPAVAAPPEGGDLSLF